MLHSIYFNSVFNNTTGLRSVLKVSVENLINVIPRRNRWKTEKDKRCHFNLMIHF